MSGKASGISFNKLDTHDVEGLKSLFDNVGDMTTSLELQLALTAQLLLLWNRPMNNSVRRLISFGVTPMSHGKEFLT